MEAEFHTSAIIQCIEEPKKSVINCCHDTGSQSSKLESVDDSLHSPDQVGFYSYDDFDIGFRRPESVDIEFTDIKYTVRQFSFAKRKFVTKDILHGISGAFRSGELTAVMGPSGCGKSTLLNIMTGYRATGVSGTIKVNGKIEPTDTRHFRNLSRYIHQDNLQRPLLKVGEAMIHAAHLKLGFKVTHEYKVKLVKNVLLLLGLDKRYNTFTNCLSGGQRKRLSIALELISNPPVLYLDEPTSGLDSASTAQCVSLLKHLAQQGHTVVCTIHQPSARIFELFDNLYGIAGGSCIYQGPVKELVPFLGNVDYHCPRDHNPADYFIELATGEHDADISKIIHAATKKYYEDLDARDLLNSTNAVVPSNQECIELPVIQSFRNRILGRSTAVKDVVKRMNIVNEAEKYIKDCMDIEEIEKIQKEIEMSHQIEQASIFMQFFLLMRRNFICCIRNHFLIAARIFSHIFIGTIFGYLYHNVGNNATTVLGNYVYLYGTILLLVYTGKMAVVLSFPLEMEMLTREHFNQWYKLVPYFLSILMFEIPFQMICTVLYVVVSFWLTGNYSEDFRFYYFTLMGVMATLSAQAWGFFVGATLPIKLAVFAGPILAVLFSVFGFCTRYIDITPMLRWMWHLSYFRAAFHGVLNAIYGMDRDVLSCPKAEKYCHFRYPKVFLKHMMISDLNMSDSILLMSLVIVIMHTLTLIVLWYRLSKK